MRVAAFLCSIVWLALVVTACGPSEPSADDEGPNPFLEDQSNAGKQDSAYYNPDGVEVEVDLEADVEALAWRKFFAPAELVQFAASYLRNSQQFYLESLDEAATTSERVEWLVDGEWITGDQVLALPPDELRRFRIRGMNAVLLLGAADDAHVGQVFVAEVPLKPYSVFSEAGTACARIDSHHPVSESNYWYFWKPEKPGCSITTQMASVTISQMFQASNATYPEYDLLVADGRLTAVLFFGQIGDGPISDADIGMSTFRRMARWLTEAGFREASDAPVGRRFTKQVGGIEVEFNLYSPYDFSGLADVEHFQRFKRAVLEYEIVVYDGHSMLGTSDFWSRLDYPDFYQIFVYGGCLGYEYYVQPILEGKGGWENIDLVSSVTEVTVGADKFAGPLFAKMIWAIENDFAASWNDILEATRRRVGDSTFGVSGVRDNCFTPSGSRCTEPPLDTAQRYENGDIIEIPDNDSTGITSVIEVPDEFTATAAIFEIDITHTWVGDLRIILVHDGVEALIWDRAGGSGHDIKRSFDLDLFAGESAAGQWTLRVSDNVADDTGTLNSWAIVLQP